MWNPFGAGSRAILEDLSSLDPARRKQAKTSLRRHKFRKSDLPALYEAIERQYPDDTDRFLSTRHALFRVLWKVNDPSTVDFIRRVHSSLPDNPDIRFCALRTLSEMSTEQSLRLLLDILIAHEPALGLSIHALFVPLLQNPKHAQVLFPKLFEALKTREYKHPIYCLAIAYRDNDRLSDTVIANCRAVLMQDYETALQDRETLPEDSQEYADAVALLQVVLDLMASFPGDPEIAAVLRSRLNDPTPAICLFAANSLVALGRDLPPECLDRIAADPSTRLDLYEHLQKLGQSQLFPPAYHTQLHFAEAQMVRWLCFPTEMGKPPDRIECIASREVTTAGRRGRVYLFRYFYEDDDSGWMVGLSGPQPSDPAQVSSQGHLTFSHFHKLDEMSTDEHFDSLLNQ